MNESLHGLILVPVVAVAAPLLVAGLGRWVQIPLVVFEIGLGIVFGPSGLGWVEKSQFVSVLSSFGLAMLFFLAGYEVDFARVRGRPIERALLGWLLSLVLGVGLGVLVAPSAGAGVLVGVCLSSTALGTIIPVLRDARELSTPFGTAVLAIGTAGEFGPLIAVALFLSGRSPARAAGLLIAFAALIAIGLLLAVRVRHHWLHRLVSITMHTSGQFAVRLVILLLAALVGLASAFGLDVLLGAFAAGVLFNVLVADAQRSDVELVNAKLDAVGFGFLVPAFFIATGIDFDLDALTRSPRTLALVPLFLLLFVVVRGIPAVLAAPARSHLTDRVAIALFGATGLPIIVAVTAIGVDHGDLGTGTAAALVGAGMLSVLIFPLVALDRHRSGAGHVGHN